MPDASEFGVGVADVLENLRKSAKPFKTMLFAFLSAFATLSQLVAMCQFDLRRRNFVADMVRRCALFQI